MSSFPTIRMRRLRQNQVIRDLIAENSIQISKLIQPIFVVEKMKHSEPIESMPGINRMGYENVLRYCEQCLSSGINSVAVFPHIDIDKRDQMGTYALDENGAIPTILRKIKASFPQLTVMTDIALDPYTSHGQDGITDADGNILNDPTNEILVKQSLMYADCHADIFAPSDMMDGRIGRIRDAMEKNGYQNAIILAYSAKYSSAFYGPYRDAVGSSSTLSGNKKTYQMDWRNSTESIREVKLDVEEGADMVMVKPALAYLDIISKIKSNVDIPLIAYQVSGEYSMIKNSITLKTADSAIISETLNAIFRAGADGIISYFALEFAQSQDIKRQLR